MNAKRWRMALAGILLGAFGVSGGCSSSSSSPTKSPSTMPSRPTTMPAKEGRSAQASPADQRVRYVADMPPIKPVKPPMPVAPPEQPPVPPVKPPMPDQPPVAPAVPPIEDELARLRKQNELLQKQLDQARPQQEMSPGVVKHLVIIWLKKHGDKEARQLLLGSRQKLKSIPGVISVSGGECLASDRPVVDSSYDLALVITFKDQASMKAYATHPIHVKLMDEVLKPNVEKYVVYDFVAK